MPKILPPDIIETARLCLRRPRLTDAADIFVYGSDPEVARYADWPVRTSMDGLAASLCARTAAWDAGDEFYWVITLPPEDRAVGGVACTIADDSAEIGFLLHRQHWGQGYMTEAAGAVLDWLRTVPSVTRVWATCDAENLASTRVLEKLGLTRDARLPGWKVRPNISDEPRDAFFYALELTPKEEHK